MSSLFSKHVKYTRFAIVLFLGALVVSGCSGSSDSQSIAETDAGDIVEGSTQIPSNDTIVVEDTVDSTLGGSSDTGVTEPAPVTPDPVVSIPSTPDSAALISTRIEFDITVPAYQSNALQVRLQWGDKDISAAFVVDESWSVVDDFPVDTQNDLIVTFNDDNGAITLGSFEQTFTTGSNESESFQITADQFDTARWDDDSDGISNLDELISGSNPLVAEAAEAPVASSELPQAVQANLELVQDKTCLLYTSPSPRDATLSRMPSSA